MSRLRVAGAIWSRRASTVKIASIPPAAPNRWPVADLVALIATLAFAPNSVLIAASSPLSPTGVDVAWAF